MSVKKEILCFVMCFMHTVIIANPSKFIDMTPLAKQYVVERLSEELPECDILLMQFRLDEFWRHDGTMPVGLSSVFTLFTPRFVASMKGNTTIEPSSIFYVYLPLDGYSNRLEIWKPKKGNTEPYMPLYPQYMPSVLDTDDCVQLICVKKQHFPFRDRLNRRPARFKEVFNDLQMLSETEFLAKHKIGNCFSNYVYSICSGGAFKVDFTPPNLPDLSDKSAPSPKELAARIRRNKEDCNLIHLSHTEVSEIVYLAYRLKGYKEGRVEYKVACAENPQILKPVEKLQTEIGNMLAKELYPKGLIEFKNGEKE